MGESEFEEFLLETLSSDYIMNMATFESRGVMTRNKGIVVRMEDGSEFQLTIVKSR